MTTPQGEEYIIEPVFDKEIELVEDHMDMKFNVVD
jgi:hypothetical protein